MKLLRWLFKRKPETWPKDYVLTTITNKKIHISAFSARLAAIIARHDGHKIVKVERNNTTIPPIEWSSYATRQQLVD